MPVNGMCSQTSFSVISLPLTAQQARRQTRGTVGGRRSAHNLPQLSCSIRQTVLHQLLLHRQLCFVRIFDHLVPKNYLVDRLCRMCAEDNGKYVARLNNTPNSIQKHDAHACWCRTPRPPSRTAASCSSGTQGSCLRAMATLGLRFVSLLFPNRKRCKANTYTPASKLKLSTALSDLPLDLLRRTTSTKAEPRGRSQQPNTD